MNPADWFLRPAALPALLLAPLAWGALRALYRARDRRLERLVGPRARALAPPGEERRRAGRQPAFALGLLCGLVAVLGPVLGDPAPEREWRGVDVVLCLDVSRSMRARDLAPDRLGRAQREIRALAGRAEGDRLGLVLFAGEARLAVPLTTDLGTLADLADLADPTSVERGGTDLGTAIDAALGALQGRTGQGAAIVLLTDGEDLGGRALPAAERCRERGVPVHALGLGTTLGSKVAAEAPAGRTTSPAGGGRGGEADGGWLRDRSGAEVVSALDAGGLARLAAATGGSFVEAGAGGSPLVGIYEDRVLPLARETSASEARRSREDHYQVFLLAALALFALDRTLGRRRERTAGRADAGGSAGRVRR